MELHNYEEYINIIVSKLLKERSIKGATIEFSPGSKAGDNYVGDITKVSITDDSLNLKESWIFKLSKQDPKLREAMKMKALFLREIYCYEKLFPILDNLQDELNIEGEDRFKHAKCLYTNHDEYFETVVMEDLTQKGYSTINRTDTFSWEMVQLAIKTMANLQALSFYMKTKRPEEFAQISKNLEFECQEHMLEIIKESMRQCNELIENKSHKERFEKFLPTLRQRMKDCYEKKSPYSVITQGDSWIKNLMFKFENHKPVDLILVDWQICRVSSPTVDLSILIFMNSGHEVRRQYMKKALDLYYDHLTKRLQTLGIDIETCYPRRIFEEEVKSFSIYGVIVGMMASSFIHAEEGLDIMEMNKEGADLKHSSKSIQFVNDLLTDAMDFGLI